MALLLNLSGALKQQQTQKLTPQMIQQLKLYKMQIDELKDEISAKAAENPAIEIKEVYPDVEPFQRSSGGRISGNLRSYDQEASDKNRQIIEGVVCSSETLQEHLLAQLGILNFSQEEYEIGKKLISAVDENGFLVIEPNLLFDEKTDEETIFFVMEYIQEFEPVGCCVSNYVESLAVQTALDDEAPDFAEDIIKNDFKLIEKHKMKELCSKYDLDLEDIHLILDYIKTLNPYPGRLYSGIAPVYIVPELSIYKKEDEILVKSNKTWLPEIKISPFFERLTKESASMEEKEFAKKYVNDAKAFIGALEMRNQTLLRTAKAIALMQSAFFMKGPEHLVPLRLKEVAEKLSLSISTLSRITTSKYIQTEWGILPLKYFFSGIASSSGLNDDVSKNSAKEMVKEIIRNYKGVKLSDQNIAEILEKEKNVKLARRTISKYRNELLIGSSFERIEKL